MNFNYRSQCEEFRIRECVICMRCNDKELLLLDKIKSYRNHAAQTEIHRRGDDLTQFLTIVSGVVALSKTMEDGRVQIVGLLFPTDFIGRPGRSQIDYDVTAIGDVTLCCFERAPFEELVSQTPGLAQRTMEIALDELDAARDWMVLLGRKTAKEKIATFLNMLFWREGATGQSSRDIHLPISGHEIASFLGLTHETVSRQLSRLRQEGIIEMKDRHHFRVLNIHALKNATGDDWD